MAGSVECSTVTARVAASGSAARYAGASACRRASRARRSVSGMCRTAASFPLGVSRRAAVLVLAGILLLSLNLRPAAVSVGPVLDELRDGLDMGPASAGLLTSLPVLAFAVFGALAPAAARRLGPHRVTLLALLAVVVGLAGRAVVARRRRSWPCPLVAVAGMAMANVLIPSLVRLHFPDRIGLVTALYTTALAVGLTAALPAHRPGGRRARGWRYGLGRLGGAGRGGGAAVVRPGQARRARSRRRRATSASATSPAPGWAGRWRCSSGCQSLKAYAVFGWFATLWRDAGFGAATASALVGHRRRDVDPALALGAAGGRPAGRPALGAGADHGLLPGRLRRPDPRAARRSRCSGR